MPDSLIFTNGIALFGLLLLVGVGVYFWMFGERTEAHEEERLPKPEEPRKDIGGGIPEVHASEFDDPNS